MIGIAVKLFVIYLIINLLYNKNYKRYMILFYMIDILFFILNFKLFIIFSDYIYWHVLAKNWIFTLFLVLWILFFYLYYLVRIKISQKYFKDIIIKSYIQYFILLVSILIFVIVGIFYKHISSNQELENNSADTIIMPDWSRQPAPWVKKDR